MVDEHRCRFDFTHFSAMTPEEIARTEEKVNQLILGAYDVTVTEMPIAEAKKLGAMALFGYFTKRDLSGIGNMGYMALIGIIIATVVNLFLRSETMMWVITYIGVLVFVALTAYDTQKIKKMVMNAEVVDESTQKIALLGSLTLYLDFINLFLYLLRILGSRK